MAENTLSGSARLARLADDDNPYVKERAQRTQIRIEEEATESRKEIEMPKPDNDVTGPVKLDTDEQYRTRQPSTLKERQVDKDIRQDVTRTSMQQNMDARGGVDDRGVENVKPLYPTQATRILWPRSWS
jgi:hypothetical protein